VEAEPHFTRSSGMRTDCLIIMINKSKVMSHRRPPY